ncbi:rhodanese-like domain-containing protein [Enterovibrio norvegicus]|uniref:Rhodanese-like domain-containing protein n=1 Tax=Enterovibrio norvegicus TaxID=188144 RepID=A0ABV4L8A6_9GAMM|nr:rhodanese-like domain-containing protein [Enterovibrio norvegicus]PMI30319.1 rhodanese [Enterovibrio norvegicus]
MILTSNQLVAEAKNNIKEISPQSLFKRLGVPVLIDVRESAELEKGMIPHAHPIARGVLEMNIQTYLTQKTGNENIENVELVLYCRSGARSALAAESLKKMGFTNVSSLEGGMNQWVTLALPVTEHNS